MKTPWLSFTESSHGYESETAAGKQASKEASAPLFEAFAAILFTGGRQLIVRPWPGHPSCRSPFSSCRRPARARPAPEAAGAVPSPPGMARPCDALGSPFGLTRTGGLHGGLPAFPSHNAWGDLGGFPKGFRSIVRTRRSVRRMVQRVLGRRPGAASSPRRRRKDQDQDQDQGVPQQQQQRRKTSAGLSRATGSLVGA